MRIETSKGKRFDARLMTELTADDSLLIQLNDQKRKLSRMAADFEGLAFITSEETGLRFEGYAVLRSISRLDQSTVQLRLYKEG